MDNPKFERLKALRPEIQGEVKCTPAMLREMEKHVYPPETEINVIPKTFLSDNYGTQIRWR